MPTPSIDPARKYLLFLPPVAVGASKVFFDLFNGWTGQLVVESVKAIKDGSAAVTGVLGVALFLTATADTGTGGTAATADSTSLTAGGITKLGARPLPAGVTARAAPAGGGTAGVVIGNVQLFSEETNAANYDGGVEMAPAPFIIPANKGIRVIQGAVASVGNVGFLVRFGALATA